MEYGENRPADKNCSGFRQRTFGDVLTKKDILYALRAILIMHQKRKILYCLSIFRFFTSLFLRTNPFVALGR